MISLLLRNLALHVCHIADYRSFDFVGDDEEILLIAVIQNQVCGLSFLNVSLLPYSMH